jgi:phosphatidylcholine synthase
MSRAIGWLVHLFTASGAALALLALLAAIDRQFTLMFWLLGAALFVDGVDGALARRFRVAETTPEIDGATLDLVVDFLTYVFTPVVAILRADLLPRLWALGLGMIVVVGSALYFADRRMKTPDNWFRGFPTLWNVVAFYLLVFRPPAIVVVAALLVGVAAMFAPSSSCIRCGCGNGAALTLTALAVWVGAALAVMIDRLDGGPFARGALLVARAAISSRCRSCAGRSRRDRSSDGASPPPATSRRARLRASSTFEA